MRVTEPQLEILSQRELRNESGRVLREVRQGRSFLVANNGVLVGRLVPVEEPTPSLAIARPARRHGGWAALGIPRKAPRGQLADLLDELREERA